jgi:hypothetical protein
MLNQTELFQNLARLEGQKLTLSEDIRQLKADSKVSEDNPSGISAEEIKLIAAAAKLYAKKDFTERKEQAEAVFNKYRELSGEYEYVEVG